MMAIDENVTAGNQKDEEPVPPPPRPTETDDAHAGKGSCQRACSLDQCSCEGFRKCIGRAGHQRRPHRCSFLPEVESTSSSSCEPRQALTIGTGNVPSVGLKIMNIRDESIVGVAGGLVGAHGGDQQQVGQITRIATSATSSKSESFKTIRGKSDWYKFCEETMDWKTNDPRMLVSGPGYMVLHEPSLRDLEVWDMQNANSRTMEPWSNKPQSW